MNRPLVLLVVLVYPSGICLALWTSYTGWETATARSPR